MKTGHQPQVISYKLFFILLIAYSLQLTADNVEAAPAVSLQELIENVKKYDGKTVTYKGEVIGDIMIRGEDAWINVRDETGALGIFCPKELTGRITYTGSYNFIGDTISASGVFHHSCPQHGGEPDIHAEKIIILKKGEAISHPLEPQKVKASIILPAVVFSLTIIHLILKRFR